MSQFNLYKKSLKNAMVEDPIDLFFYRPIGFVLANVFMRTPVTPNSVTAISMLSGIITGIFYTAGQAPTTLVAGLLLLITNILDCTDGQLARMKDTSSKLGRILDGFADYVTGMAVFIGIVIGYSGKFYTLPVWWGLVILAAFSDILQSCLVDTYRSRFIAWMTGRSQNLKDELKEFEEENKNKSANKFERFIIKMYCLYLRWNIKMSPPKSRSMAKTNYDRLIMKNKLIIRGWSMIGPSTRITIAVIVSLMNRPDLYFIAIVIPINLFALILYILQSILDSKEKE